jgi:hypothetical protein
LLGENHGELHAQKKKYYKGELLVPYSLRLEDQFVPWFYKLRG